MVANSKAVFGNGAKIRSGGPHLSGSSAINASDGAFIASLTIPGRPYSKKTSQRIVRRRILPSQNFIDYQERSGPCLLAAWAGKETLDFGLRIVMRVWMPSWASMPDHCGLMQSLGDVLEHHKVIADDAWLVWDTSGTHWLSGIDKENPRVEITLYRLRHPKETRKEIIKTQCLSRL